MGKIFYFIINDSFFIVFYLCSYTTFSQTALTQNRKNSIFLEIGGRSPLYSINYERTIQLKGKIIAVDASLVLYQFLASIRQMDGKLLTDSKGNVTSHLIGLLSRTTNMLKWEIKPVYIFDGKPPELKHQTQTLRKETKIKNRF